MSSPQSRRWPADADHRRANDANGGSNDPAAVILRNSQTNGQAILTANHRDS